MFSPGARSEFLVSIRSAFGVELIHDMFGKTIRDAQNCPSRTCFRCFRARAG
jgi:hypothetical protein